MVIWLSSCLVPSRLEPPRPTLSCRAPPPIALFSRLLPLFLFFFLPYSPSYARLLYTLLPASSTAGNYANHCDLPWLQLSLFLPPLLRPAAAAVFSALLVRLPDDNDTSRLPSLACGVLGKERDNVRKRERRLLIESLYYSPPGTSSVSVVVFASSGRPPGFVVILHLLPASSLAPSPRRSAAIASLGTSAFRADDWLEPWLFTCDLSEDVGGSILAFPFISGSCGLSVSMFIIADQFGFESIGSSASRSNADNLTSRNMRQVSSTIKP